MILNLQDLVNKYSLKINGVIHIGAHFGEEHITYKNLNINTINYFEPVKKTFNILQERVLDANLFNYALGNENKEIDMYKGKKWICGLGDLHDGSAVEQLLIYAICDFIVDVKEFT